VDLITTGIAVLTADAVVTTDGTRRPTDALVYGTGFQIVEPLQRLDVTGRDGRRLADAWRDGAEAYLGTVVTGFPNLYLLLGPNTGLGHNSVVFMAEQQIGYVLRALHQPGPLEVRADVQARYNRALRARLGTAVWSTGCRSWYLDENGVNRVIWPGFSWRYAVRMRRFRRADYR
jgi:cation diffusion facilitator CzcD-associated flavoprotein CzcO